MNDRHKLGRREFLRLTAITTGSAVIAACGGASSGTTPTAQGGGATAPAAGATSGPAPTVASEVKKATAIKSGGKFKEAPALAEMVKAGKLPAVAERLPKNPYVVPHKWLTPGKYGGQMRMGGSGSDAAATSGNVKESMYGHSPLRWLKDGREIGAGLVEEWGPNADQSEWTLHFREGLKWSDGKPWTTEDVMYWWQDMVLNEEHPETPPDEARSGKGTLVKMVAPDDTTLVLKYDAPQPLLPELLCKYVKRGIGPHWMAPKHYMKQFHPKYNPKLKGKKDWMDAHDEKLDFSTNPTNPVMTGWRLTQLKEGQSSSWERNPYYWCVDKEGNQLPYIDGITYTTVQDPEVMKLNFQQGKVDFVNGGHTPLDLGDVAGLKQAEPRSGLEVRFWDSGSGTGSIFFFNYDYDQKKMRELIRNPKFRKALSHAFNRKEVQKVLYFGTGELTTGTYSPKTMEFNLNDQGKGVYQQWRDSAIEYDPKLAKKLLDEIGVVDKNGDGLREMADGSKLVVTLDYPADTTNEHKSKNNLLAKDWKAIGIDAKINPVPPTGYDDRWEAGKLMSKTAWEVGDSMGIWVSPQWLLPIEPSKWAPLEGTWWSLRGTPDEKKGLNKDPFKRTPPRMEPEKGDPVDRMWKSYARARVEPDPMKRAKMAWDIVKVHVEEGPFFMGCVANYPRIVLVKKGLKNVPRHEDLTLGGFVNPWHHPTPAVYDPEAYYWDNPAQHS